MSYYKGRREDTLSEIKELAKQLLELPFGELGDKIKAVMKGNHSLQTVLFFYERIPILKAGEGT